MTRIPLLENILSSKESRRKHSRSKNIIPVKFAVAHSPEDVLDLVWQQGFTTNLSQEGFCLEAVLSDAEILRRFSLGKSYVELRIGLPWDAPAVKALGEMVWMRKDDRGVSEKYFIGIKWAFIDQEGLRAVLRYTRRVRVTSAAVAVISALFFLALGMTGWMTYATRRSNEAMVQAVVTAQREAVKTLEGVLEGGARRAKTLQPAVLKKMSEWLRNNRGASMGLVLSSQGAVGETTGWASPYDQSLAVQAFLALGRQDDARDILNFFHGLSRGTFEGFYQRYDYVSGKALGGQRDCGGTVWIGVAALQYTRMTGDRFYLFMARQIADWLGRIQAGDPSGGLKGGMDVAWFSLEHNLDAYVFFDMMFQVTGEEEYRGKANRILSWLKNHELGTRRRDYTSPPKDLGIATATISSGTRIWALATLGAATIARMGVSPEKIFSESGLREMEIDFVRPDQSVQKVTGFAFDPLAGISPEWTARVSFSLQELADYFFQMERLNEAMAYARKAEMARDAISAMIISSPSDRDTGEACLPRALSPDDWTSSGERVLQGDKVCSAGATAYGILAGKGLSPVRLWTNPLLEKEGEVKE